MPAQWTADIIGKMHMYRIAKKQLAGNLGMTPEYISMILNGHREPPGAEERFRRALDELISQQDDGTKKQPINKT